MLPPWSFRSAGAAAATLAASLIALLLGGCSTPAEESAPAPAAPAGPRQVHDLIERFSAAEVLQPTAEIDFADPASRQGLLSGWAIPARAGDDGKPRPVWSKETAELEFYVDGVGKLQVAMRCAPRVGTTPPRLSFQVNGSPWEEFPLQRGMRRYLVHLPAELLQPGRNRLRIVTSAADGAPGDHRVRWQWIRFHPDSARTTSRPMVRADRQALFIPYGTRVDYFLELPPHSAVQVAKLRNRGDSGGRLRILWQPVGEEERIVAEPSTGEELELALVADAGASGRLSFLAVGSRPAAAPSAGVLLFAPAVHTRSAAARAAEPLAAERPQGSPPNIVLYLIDTLRADHLGCYGYGLDTSPHIDRFAETAVLFDNAQAQSPWTRSSVASVMTGLLPQVHGANDDDDALAAEIVTLAELLRAAGYRTVAVTGNGNAARGAGFAQGFDVFDHRPRREGEELPRSSELNTRTFPFLEQQGAERPFFLLVHTIDPHAPYDPPQPFRSRFAATVDDPELGSVERMVSLGRYRDAVPGELIDQLVALYDAEIAANDHSFGALVAELRKHGLYDNSLIILLSDHGEEFYDHGGWVHGKTLHAEMLDTPLIVKLPGMTAGRRAAEIAQHVDLLPTIADTLGLAVPDGVHGRSLLPILRGAASADGSDRALAHLDLRGRLSTSFIDGRWKIIQKLQPETFPELYDRQDDRGEQHNLAAEQPDLARLMASIRKSEEAAAGEAFEPPQIDISEKIKMRQELKALGYIQ